MTTLMSASPTRSGRSGAQPRWATPRRPERPTLGRRVAEIARLLGTPFMPWQDDAVDVAFEYDPKTGLFFYREVDLIVMRQSGKTAVEFAATVDRCISWPRRQRCVYSAQYGQDSRRKLLDDWVPQLEGSPLAGLIRPPRGKVIRTNGAESIRFPAGLVETLAALEAAGHGFTVDFGLIDEAWKDLDERREQAIRPAQVTVEDAQLWVVSTAGKDRSVYLRRKVDAGRAVATEDPGEGICYIEYSIPDDADIDDPATWRRYMPALCPAPVDGRCACSRDWRHTQTERAIAADRQGMEDSEFRRAYGNQWPSGSGERVIPAGVWDDVQDSKARPKGEPTWGLDVLPDRSAGAIGAGAGGCVAVIHHRAGTGWMVETMKRLHAERGGRVVVDGGGPAVPIADDLEDERVPVDRLNYGEVAAACARMYDAIADRRVRVYPSAALDAAVDGLAKKPVGDRFVWSRTASTADATPFMAVTLAYPPRKPKPRPRVLVARGAD